MFLLFFIECLFCVLCVVADSDLGYSLNVGNAIDIFANYGDLCQVMQVVSLDYEQDDGEVSETFREKNIKVFVNAPSTTIPGGTSLHVTIDLCESFPELLSKYYQPYEIEGADESWKAFMADLTQDEIMRTFGMDSIGDPTNCCYVLVKITKKHEEVTLGNLTRVSVKSYVKRAVERLNSSDTSQIRKFSKSYGTHYIESYATGNVIYQLFKFKRIGYNLLKSYIKLKNTQHQPANDNIRFYFSSVFLTYVGEIRVASGNKVVEEWAQSNLKDRQYLYSQPSLLKLYYSPTLANQLMEIMDTGALVGLKLKTLTPVFSDTATAERYNEVVLNDMKLWDVNS